MATEPVSTGLFAALVAKLGLVAAVGAVGGFIISLFDKAETRRERAIQAACAGTASLVFGKLAAKVAGSYITSVSQDDLLLPVAFLIGAVSWGVFGALSKLRKLIADKGADAVADKVGLK